MFVTELCVETVKSAFARLTKLEVRKAEELLKGCSYEVATMLVKLAKAIGPAQRGDDPQVTEAWFVVRDVLAAICDCGLNAGRVLTNVGWVPVTEFRVPQCLSDAMPSAWLVPSSWLGERNMRQPCQSGDVKVTSPSEYEGALAILASAARNRQIMETLVRLPDDYGESKQVLNLDVVTVVTSDGKFYGCGMSPEKIVTAIPIADGIGCYARKVGEVDDYAAYLLTLLS